MASNRSLNVVHGLPVEGVFHLGIVDGHHEHAPGNLLMYRHSNLLHPVDAEFDRRDGGIQRHGQPQPQHVAGLHRVEHAVVPQAGAAVIGVPLGFVLGQDGIDDRLFLFDRQASRRPVPPGPS